MAESIHIVCLDAPSPPDYGGAIDMYYKIQALGEAGTEIILHYFDYKADRGIGELKRFCKEIYPYKRKGFMESIIPYGPYITRSRWNKDLIQRLNEDALPVLLEGIHCTAVLPFLREDKKVIIRVHNDEAIYYEQLAVRETNPVRKLYFRSEANLLKNYQKELPKSACLAILSSKDESIFRYHYRFRDVHFIPCFIPWQTISGQDGKGQFCLYHGNMKVSENEAAAQWLIQEVFSNLTIPLVIAGRGISPALQEYAKEKKHIKLISNPSMDEIEQLVRDAHIHVLPSMNATGVKLKLLHALFEGRFCISNNKGVEGSGITSGLHTAEEPAEWISLISSLIDTQFTQRHREEREELADVYNNRLNSARLSELW